MFRNNGEYGVTNLDFEDAEGKECIMYDGWFIDEDVVIYFGVADRHMSLTREQVRLMIPYLENFVKTGELE